MLLDWESRMRVALAVGRGLAHLHASATLAHSNLLASNVILRHNPAFTAVSGYALGPLFALAAAPPLRIPSYRMLVVVETRRPSFKADVYSFGVLLFSCSQAVRATRQAWAGAMTGWTYRGGCGRSGRQRCSTQTSCINFLVRQCLPPS